MTTRNMFGSAMNLSARVTCNVTCVATFESPGSPDWEEGSYETTFWDDATTAFGDDAMMTRDEATQHLAWHGETAEQLEERAMEQLDWED